MTKRVQVKDVSDDEALEAYRERQRDRSLPGALEQFSKRYPQKVALRKLEQLAVRGMIEYGTTIAYAWPVA
jgi:hypothetical protein